MIYKITNSKILKASLNITNFFVCLNIKCGVSVNIIKASTTDLLKASKINTI